MAEWSEVLISHFQLVSLVSSVYLFLPYLHFHYNHWFLDSGFLNIYIFCEYFLYITDVFLSYAISVKQNEFDSDLKNIYFKFIKGQYAIINTSLYNASIILNREISHLFIDYKQQCYDTQYARNMNSNDADHINIINIMLS